MGSIYVGRRHFRIDSNCFFILRPFTFINSEKNEDFTPPISDLQSTINRMAANFSTLSLAVISVNAQRPRTTRRLRNATKEKESNEFLNPPTVST